VQHIAQQEERPHPDEQHSDQQRIPVTHDTLRFACELLQV
jgi:hypothetical protein